nr:serine/threonine-protein kinase [Kofleriaceae bacterium]
MEPTPQKSLERYEVLDRIAVGGMAEVFLAKAYGAHGFEKTLAIKRILPELAQNPEFEARFIAEAKVSVRLSHANIVQVLDFGRIGESLFIAMEYVDGLDLAAMQRRFKDEGRLIPLPAAFHIAIEMLRAIDYAHQHNVVHRDVSPSNILISRAGEVKIADFGIAVAAQPHRGGVSAGVKKVMGKWRYMSPEQTRGEPLDTRSDLFSAAVVMFEMFTGDKLFPGDESDDIIKNIDRMPIPRMAQMRNAIPSRLDEVMAPALARKPIDRPNRPAQLLRALIELSYESSIMATALDVAEALATVLPATAQAGRGALDDVIRKQLGDNEKSVARRTAVTNNKPPSTETAERNDVSTGLFRKLDDDGLARLELDPTAVRHTEPMEKPEITDVHRLFERAEGRDRNTEVGGPPSSSSNLVVAADGTPQQAIPRTKTKTKTGTTGRGSDPAEPTDEAPRSRALLAVLGLGGLAAIVVVVVVAMKGNPPAPVTAPIDAAAPPPVDTTATLELDSNPSGATISVDGKVVGSGPQHITVSPTKKHHVLMTLAGHVSFDDDGLSVVAGRTVVIRPTLDVAPALAKIDSTPPGAQVSLHDQVIGTTPFTTKPLPAEAGAELVFAKAGFDSARVKIDLKAGETTEVMQPLKEQIKYGTLTISVKDSFADVYVDGKPAPFSDGDARAGIRNRGIHGLRSVKLLAGHHHVHLVNSITKAKRDVDVDVVADRPKSIEITLD